jgi:hypothetical protein
LTHGPYLCLKENPHKTSAIAADGPTVTGQCSFQGFNLVYGKVKRKGKIHPTTGHKDPEGEYITALYFL